MKSTGGSQTELALSENRAWTPRPVAARTVRLVQVVLPFIAGWLAIRGLRPAFFGVNGTGWVTFVLWLVQAVFVAFVVSATVARLVARFTPLAALLNMSLVFPDSTPSRFGLALRTGTVKRLMAEPTLKLSSSAQAAAEEAVQLVTHLGKHEPLTRGHTERVRAYADIIGQQMGLSEDDLNGLRWGALLHDVGKLTVPAEILNKPGKPTAEEWEILKRHPGAAVPILEPLSDWLGDWLLAAPQHHERFDGTGYPAGIAGRDISLAGRITAVADAYDVITSRRSYKEPKSAEFAREEMVRSAGSHFDPVVVKALLEAGVTRSWYGRRFGWLLELPAIVRALTAAGQVAAATTAAVSVSMFIPSSMPPNTTPDSVAFPAGVPFIQSEADRVVNEPAVDDELEEAAAPSDAPNGDLQLIVTTTTSLSTSPNQDSGATVESSATPATSNPQNPASSTTVPVTPTTRAVTTTSRVATSTPTTRPTTTTTARPTTITTTTTAPTTTTLVATVDCTAVLSGVTFLPGADLRGCDMSNLVASGLHLADARLDGANLAGAQLTDFNMERADLSGANLTEAVLTRGSFRDAELDEATAVRLTATEVGFQNADMRGIALGGSRFVSTSFEGADVRNSTYRGALFENADFKSVDMRGLNLSFADLSNLDFTNANIDQVNFKAADLSGTTFVGATGVPADVTSATFRITICPDSTSSNSSCW